MAVEIDDELLYAELLRRKRARDSLIAFAKSVDIPGAPLDDDPDEWLCAALEAVEIADLHQLIMREVQACLETYGGRLMIFAPPGSAKTTYAAVVPAAWWMGKKREDVIVTSYASTPAERISKRARAIVTQLAYRSIWRDRQPAPGVDVTITKGDASVKEWTMTNGSRLLAAGVMGSVTSARAGALIIDDPVAGREEADSEVIRNKTKVAYEDDLLTRLKPGASVIIMQTRWHQDDLAGSILPENWDGESGFIECRDGQTWKVVCIPAECDRDDDPLKRKKGEMLWPQWFKAQHWAIFRKVQRTWSALFQQRPTPGSGGEFEREWFLRYEKAPSNITWFGASDWAVTKKKVSNNPDWTEHVVSGIDDQGVLYLEDGWDGQEKTGTTIAAFLDLVDAFKPVKWGTESGVIRNAMEDPITLAMREMDVYVTMVYPPSMGDKVANSAAFQARAQAGMVRVKKGPWGDRIINQLCLFPMGKRDDGVDACGLIGRMIDSVRTPPPDEEEVKKAVKPFAGDQWLQAVDREDEEARRRAEEYDE